LEIREKKAKRNLELQLADPDHEKKIEGLLQLGDSYSVLNDVENAVAYYKRAAEFNCKSGQIDLKMHAMNKYARHLAKLNKLEEAKEIYEKCIKQFPKDEDAFHGLAMLLIDMDKKAESMPLLRKILTMKANVSIGGSLHFAIKQSALRNLCLWEYEQGNFKLSRNYAEQMIKEDKENDEAKYLFERSNVALLNKNDNRPLLSVCMIVKNEEENIGECLKSMQGLADEIIVTDTGSTDKTVEIAQSYNARIEHFEWTKDFSAARNHSVSKAGCRWIVWFDADDRLPKKTVEELRKILSLETPNKVFSLVVCNSIDEGKTGTKFSQVRVFPNNKQIKFEGRIHEQILPSIRKLGFPEIKLPLEVFHTGYENPAMQKEKLARNLELFKEQFPGEKGMNPLDMFHYATCYEILGDYESALKWFRQSIIESKKHHYNELLVLLPSDIARILENQGDLQGALESLDLSLKEDPQFEPAITRKARIHYTLGQHEEAVKWFGYAASLIPKPNSLPTNEAAMHKNSLKFLADHWNKTGQTAIAVDILRTLKNMMLGIAHNPLALAEIYIAHDKAVEALDNLEFLKKDLGDKPEFLFLYAQAFALTEKVQEAIDIVLKAKEKFPQNENIAELAKAMGI